MPITRRTWTGPVLALDTSGPRTSVALLGGLEPVVLVSEPADRAGQVLHEMMRAALSKAGCSPRDLRLLAAVRGPGSFTGLRVGLAALAGLQAACGIPAVGVATVAAAALASGLQGRVVVLLEAGQGRLAAGLVAVPGGTGGVVEVIEAAADMDAPRALAYLRHHRGKGGRGVLRGVLPDPQPFLDEGCVRLEATLAKSCGQIALAGEEPSACEDSLVPLYGREPAISAPTAGA